jgi:hypothetical protein
MFILSKKIAPIPRRNQIFNDHTAEDASQEKREDDERWRKRIVGWVAAVPRLFEIARIGVNYRIEKTRA